jgi:hypothetical protein
MDGFLTNFWRDTIEVVRVSIGSRADDLGCGSEAGHRQNQGCAR